MGYRVLILIQGTDIAASRYRILQYIPFLQSHGLGCDVHTFPSGIHHYWSLFRALAGYDCVFVQRKRFHFPVLPFFRMRAKRIVYDLDDAVMYRNSLGKSPYSRTRERRFRNMVRSCDAVVAGNTFLMEKVQAYTPNVVVIPTSIPVDRYSVKDYSIRKEKITIGWIGDHGSIHYLERLKPVWNEIGRRFSGKVELKIICDTFFDCEEIPVRKVPWSDLTEVVELQDIDIGVMPLIDDPWSWGKCGLKILQYYGAGVPAVCTPVGINRDVVSDGRNGFWARTDEEWVKKISVLIEDDELRERMGIAGRKTLEEAYTDRVNSLKILGVIKPEGSVSLHPLHIDSPGRIVLN
ncbi:MAG: glycosyltransferase family 4 protein [Desulfomonilia bacterium]